MRITQREWDRETERETERERERKERERNEKERYGERVREIEGDGRKGKEIFPNKSQADVTQRYLKCCQMLSENQTDLYFYNTMN